MCEYTPILIQQILMNDKARGGSFFQRDFSHRMVALLAQCWRGVLAHGRCQRVVLVAAKKNTKVKVAILRSKRNMQRFSGW